MVEKTLKKIHRNNRGKARRWGISKLKSVGVFHIDSKPISSSKNTQIESEFLIKFGCGLADSYMKEMKERIQKSEVESGFVYFIGSHHFRFVKIGFSKCPEKRVKQIQTGCPFNICILGKVEGDTRKEKEFHRKFQKNRTRGEWFTLSNEIRDLIDSCKS